MNRGVGIWRCTKCRMAFFPERLLCARCFGQEFDQDRIYKAVVEETSTIRHMLGQADWQPRLIASVRLAEGQRITVGVSEPFLPGTVIELFEDGTAPYGEARKAAG
jgi:uncharacterized OB-fold protein